MLDVSRITSGKIQLKRERLDIKDVIDRAVETARPLLESKQHELSLSLPSEPLIVSADTTRLEQVIGNLLTNAAKYTDEGGSITLSARHDGDVVLITVRDTGVGLSAAMLPRIFELFTQVDTSRGRSRGGLGVGLSLARTLVELHGGTITAASEGSGKGSEFSVRLPGPSNGRPTPAEPPGATKHRDAPADRIEVRAASSSSMTTSIRSAAWPGFSSSLDMKSGQPRTDYPL